MPIDMLAVARAHAFMLVECPPAPWSADVGDGRSTGCSGS